MRLHLFVLCLIMALSGCGKADRMAGDRGVASPAPGSPQEKERSYLAYSHAMTVEVEEGKVRAAFDAGQAACAAAAADLCAILESEISTGERLRAILKVRAKPAGIAKVRAAFKGQGEITEQSTSAEDLAAPISDGEKKLSMLKDYRSKLEGLRDRAGNDVDALIKVNQQLASVQAELESAAGAQAHLIQRVDTEILTVNIDEGHNVSFAKPITLAFKEFGMNLSKGTAAAVTVVAFLLPCAVALGVLVWIGRRVVRWRKRRQHGV